ncbi:LysM peptidoglycan-binding domain-containing protein [Wenyingzhuangia sp. chi5]|uniref:LysM peptidoglycan-binding domain-containing protein n=1 Tax=Wenyingzhuangia gilva TaxID=3057677 RepID=A0ABT8VR81_9FLAO|nr:LysM peptidoglycan-binding domain-containing protein [Wenyingzhuangia sp. chi5]MDO3694464.1 LysM peptidoglycan-binding domain-containing protein [Wenyingzhuangia sp. chi5]
MRIFKIFSFFLIMMSASVFAQTIKEYKTEKGESLRDVAKKFDISYKDLMKANPEISRWPKSNTLIKIPTQAPKLDKKIKRPKDRRPDDKKDLVNASSKDSMVIHIVEPKETLYSLSKLYDVEMITLIKDNPVLTFDGLKIGQELKVPYKAPKILEASKNHIVKGQETWYGISKLYHVTIEDLKVANPKIAIDGLKVGSVLEIPESNDPAAQKQISENLDKNSHVIAKGETLYSVSKSYGISVKELLAVNDTVVVDSLVIGTVLKLPKKVIESVAVSTASPFYKQTPVFYKYYNQKDTLSVVLEKYKMSLDSLKSLNPTYKNIVDNGGKLLMGFKKTHQLFGNKEWFKDSIVTNKRVKAMVMLPFDFKKNDSLSKEELFSNPNGLPTYVSDFYLGVEIAIDSLKKQGVQVELNVVDTEKSVDSIYKNIAKFKAMEPDVIIGPLYSSNAMYVATQFTSTPVYYPIYSKKQSTFMNNNLIKTSSEKSLFEKEILAFIKENRKGEHLLIVGLNAKRNDLLRLKNQLSKKDSVGNVLTDDVSILTLANGYISKAEFLSKIKLDKPNWILIADTDNVVTSDVFNNVMSLPKENKSKTPVRILSFEKSDYINKLAYESLYKYHYTYATDEVEYREIENKSFEQSYVRKNNQYPSYHATRGFDVTYDAILRVLKTKTGGKNLFAPSYRTKTAFVYKKGGVPTKTNQAVFVNAIENTKKDGLKIVRLR